MPNFVSASHNHRWRWVLVTILVSVAVVAVATAILVSHAEPILRARVVETLSVRFHSRVEMAEFRVWYANGLEVSGRGLKVYGRSDPNIHQPGIQPLIAIEEFRFRTGVFNLLRSPMTIETVRLKGLALNIPPAGDREQMKTLGSQGGKTKILVRRFVSDDAQLVINTSRLDKLPLEFSISKLTMQDVGPNRPLEFAATLVNPKPVGNISSRGSFGPWDADHPRETAVEGEYSFSNADLSTIKGIGGILSSTGKYSGSLGSIVVDGKTDTPDFQLAVSGHRVPLRTQFHAVVDGTSGDTYLQPVRARLLNSEFVASGSVVRVKDPNGHQVLLDVSIDAARIEDFLELGVRTDPPLMTGSIRTKVKFDLSPGPADVAERMKLAGDFHVSNGRFSSDKIQDKINSLSLRSQGEPNLAEEHHEENIACDLNGTFRLSAGLLSFSKLDFQVPGTRVEMTGQYSLDGNRFDFHGRARLDAALSHMVTGWKSIVLKPVDPFFRKDGAGTEVPFKITGTRSEPHFGLDFGHSRSQRSAGATRH